MIDIVKALKSIGVDPTRWEAAIKAAWQEFDIVNPTAQRMFLSQVAHESGRFKYMREIWGPTPAQHKYEGRKDLGNNHVGDGFKYRGRGLVQITGRANYSTCGTALKLDLINHPELLEEPTNAVRSAAWYWTTHGCSQLAERGDFNGVTRRINGGTNGLEDRLKLYSKILGAS